MKFQFTNPFYILATVMVLFHSCKKEKSCEGCNGNNKPPIAIAGPDKAISLPTDSISLDGSASSDPDGAITNWLWTKIAGPASFNIINSSASGTAVKNLQKGVYHFELKVTDNEGLSATDTVQITVYELSQPELPPVADAGVDQTITLLTNSVMLNGINSWDPNNNITNFAWTKISGPISYSFANSSAVQTQVTNLVEGIYQFELKVTDALGLFSKDTTQVTVIIPPPPCTECRIVFVSDRDGNPEIYISKEDGSNIQRLTYDIGNDEHPAWSPDGTKIAFISNRSGHYEVYIMNRDGSNPVRKTFSASYTGNPSWSPDGTRIIYSTVSNGSLNIWVIGAASGSPSLLFEAPGWDSQPTWSPDGTKIALVSDWAAYDFVYDIYTINADGTGFTPLTGNIPDQFDYMSPQWSPNGTKIAMAIRETVGIDEYNTRIATMNPNGSGITVLASGAEPWFKIAWSGDGSKIAYTSLSASGIMNVSWISTIGAGSGIIISNGWDADWQH